MWIVTKNFPYQTTKFRISIPIQARTETFCFENSRLFSSVNNSKVVFRFLGHRSLPKILIDRQFESCSWAWNSLMVLSNWPRACWLVLGNSKSGHTMSDWLQISIKLATNFGYLLGLQINILVQSNKIKWTRSQSFKKLPYSWNDMENYFGCFIRICLVSCITPNWQR